MQYKGITVGVPREIMHGEKRAAIIPETARTLINNGAKVLVEKGIGEGAFWDDADYAEAGAAIAPGPAEIYGNANVFLKVKEPLYNEELGTHEAGMLPEKSTLISFLHPANPSNHEMIKTLAGRGIVSYTLDGVPRIPRAQKMDALTAMSTVAGYKAALFATDHLPRFIPLMPTAFGIIKASEFLVIGTGIAGLQATATARRLGAKVKTLDIRPEANEQAKSLGAEVISFDVPGKLSVGEKGYARRLPEKWYFKERKVIAEHLKDIDALILTALIPGEQAPVLIDREMVETMKKGSVIIDVAIDQGGNCRLSEPGATRIYANTLISGTRNIPAELPVDSTWMFSQSIMHFLNYIVKEGTINTDADDEIIRDTLTTIDGKIVHKGALKAMKTE